MSEQSAAREYVEPSEAQLVNFVCVSVGARLTDIDRTAIEAVLAVPSVRGVWLRRHRELQEAAWRLEDEG